MPKSVDSHVVPLIELFQSNFTVDFYQREYVWTRKQIADLLTDLFAEFSRNYREEHETTAVQEYEPYYMGEVVLAGTLNSGKLAIIDGQQRITTLTLLLIFLYQKCKSLPENTVAESLSSLIYSNSYGRKTFKIDIPERTSCLLSLFADGSYVSSDVDVASVKNIADRYADIEELWDAELDDAVEHFAYWVINKTLFSRVVTDSEAFAYVIFETMNDRGLSLTQIEMLRSYLLANVDPSLRTGAIQKFNAIDGRLNELGPKGKMASDFFKVFLRTHYADDLSQSAANTDFNRIGSEFHRWVRDKDSKIGLLSPSGFLSFIDRIDYFSRIFVWINTLLKNKNSSRDFYMIVNDDYKFTLQPAVLLASASFGETEEQLLRKFSLLSKFLSKVLSWRIWNQRTIAQSSMEAPIYALCKKIREKSLSEIPALLQEWESSDFPEIVPRLDTPPVLNQQNRAKTRVLLALITEIVARESGESGYVLGTNEQVEVEHVWADHFDRHSDEFASEQDFALTRNGIGDLLVLPKSFNASYGDLPYAEKRIQYFSQNILAQTLCPEKYANNPGFVAFRERSNLPFKPYDSFTKDSIQERAELYRQILLWNWREPHC